MKSWISSKTLWFNVLAAGLSVLIDSVSTAPIDPQYQVLIVALRNLGANLYFQKHFKLNSLRFN